MFFFDLQVVLDDFPWLIFNFFCFVSFLVFLVHFRIVSVPSTKVLKFGVLHAFLFLNIFKNMRHGELITMNNVLKLYKNRI